MSVAKSFTCATKQEIDGSLRGDAGKRLPAGWQHDLDGYRKEMDCDDVFVITDT